MKEFEWMKQEAVDFFGDFLLSEEAKNIGVAEGAYEKLKELKSAWYVLNVVTARRDFLKERTYQWLDKNLPSLISDVYFTNSFWDNHIKKSEVIKKLWVEYMFEDNYDYACDISWNCNIPTFLISKPWNEDIEIEYNNIIRLNSWNDFDLTMVNWK